MEQSALYTRDKCPVCGGKELDFFLKSKDHTVSGAWFTIVSCRTCAFKFTNPSPSPQFIGGYYKAEEYISHSGTRRGLVARLYHLVRMVTLRRKFKLTCGSRKKGRLLDYGCGTGNYLRVAQERGWSTYGLEPDEGARSTAGKGVKVFEDLRSLQQGVEGKFDVVTMWHVLEHVFELNEVLRYLNTALADDGKLFVAVPNHRSFDALFYGEHWAAYDLPRHLYHFDRESIRRLFLQQGFLLQKSIPMHFDSYYVSMLSELYKRGKSAHFKAFFTGLRSNFKARRSGEYSSLIYVFGKSQK